MSGLKRLLIASVLFLAFLSLVFISAMVTMKAVTWGGTVVVPDVSGRALAAAVTALRADGLDIKIAREEHHPTVPAGSVISQLPLPGASVKKGRNVSVVVSLGSQEVTVPDLHGQTVRMALIMVGQAGLALGEVARAALDEPKDLVAAQDPLAQAVVQKGTGVSLLASDGPPPGAFITPDLSGKSAAAAGAVMRPMSVTVSPTGKGEVVVSQDPRPGYPVYAGGTIKAVMGARPPVPAPVGPPSVKKPPAPPVGQLPGRAGANPFKRRSPPSPSPLPQGERGEILLFPPLSKGDAKGGGISPPLTGGDLRGG